MQITKEDLVITSFSVCVRKIGLFGTVNIILISINKELAVGNRHIYSHEIKKDVKHVPKRAHLQHRSRIKGGEIGKTV